MNDSQNTPPASLTAPLELNPSEWSPRDIYHLHAALIVPRPIGWISSVSTEGLHNLAPHSYFNAVCDEPPMVMFVVDGEHDTYRNVSTTKEFVVNLVSADLASAMELSAVDFPAEEDEFKWSGLETCLSRTVKPLRVKRSKACLECEVSQVMRVGQRNHMVIGTVRHYFVSDSVWRHGRVDPRLLDPLARLGGRYAELGAIFANSRPLWTTVRQAGPGTCVSLVDRTDAER
jgi:flavin reductase (DIM6/NTAB) family NADH-FMN oxidoreductase RutF